ncbi:hypothetical protein H0A66_18475 [Alcaligenaceae bacterium]|nr:hypothetical protein [Alcaligenaceae bacterium]
MAAASALTVASSFAHAAGTVLGSKLKMLHRLGRAFEVTGQIIEGHVPAIAVNKLFVDSSVKGVSAPGMLLNAPGIGELDGNLITVDFNGKPFSKD